MKKILLIAFLLIFNLGFAQNYSESFTASIDSEVEQFDAPAFDTAELDELGIMANMNIGEVAFNAPEKIDYINIFNSDNQEIFSAKGSIIENNKIDLSYLPEGTYYLEVVIGKNIGSHKLIK